MMSSVSRRTVITAMVGSLFLPVRHALAASSARLYVNAYGSADGYGFAGFDENGHIHYSIPLPQRGHSFAHCPDGGSGVAFGRRPGDFAVVFDLRSGQQRHMIRAADDRSFCGHGAYTRDGRLLFATEVIASQGEGVLGIYDARDGYRRVGEWSTHGLDPHEILLMPDGHTLAVANGGILMRADMPRLKLNIPDMAPSLVYIDSRDGRLAGMVKPATELHQLSTRHIAIDHLGRVAVAMQYEGPRDDAVPLVALHDPRSAGGEFSYLPMPEAERAALRQYCGSAAVDRSGRFLAVSSPRGNRVLIWNLAAAGCPLLFRAELADVCGIGASGGKGGFMLSAGTGARLLWKEGLSLLRPEADAAHRLRWDNHMMTVSGRTA